MEKLQVTLNTVDQRKIKGKLVNIARLCKEICEDLETLDHLSVTFSKKETEFGLYLSATGSNDVAIVDLFENHFLAKDEMEQK